jgi:hypothetical protein
VVFSILLQEALRSRGDSELNRPSRNREKFEFDAIHDYVKKMTDNSQLRDLLLDMLDESGGSLATARLALEDSFNERLDAASGIYGRKVQMWASMIAATLTVVFNIDTISIFQWGLDGFTGQIPLGWSAAVWPASFYEWIVRLSGWLITIAIVARLTPVLFSLGRIIAQRLRGGSRRERVIDAKIDALANTNSDDVLDLAAKQSKLLDEYYKIVLDQSRKSFLSALVATVVGLLFFMGAIGYVLSSGEIDAAIVSAIAGALVEVIAGINFALYSKTTAQLADFQTRLDMTQRFLLANQICENLKYEAKEKTRSQLVLMIAQTTPGNKVSDTEK